MYYLTDVREQPKIKRIELQPIDDGIEIEVIWVRPDDDYGVVFRNILETVNSMLGSKLQILHEDHEDFLYDGDYKVGYINNGWDCEHNFCYDLIVLGRYLEDDIIDIQIG